MNNDDEIEEALINELVKIVSDAFEDELNKLRRRISVLELRGEKVEEFCQSVSQEPIKNIPQPDYAHSFSMPFQGNEFHARDPCDFRFNCGQCNCWINTGHTCKVLTCPYGLYKKE